MGAPCLPLYAEGETVYHGRVRYTVLAIGQDRNGATILQIAFTSASNGAWVGQWAGAVRAADCTREA